MPDLEIPPELPAEIYYAIFKHLDYNDMRAVRNVNSRFRSLAQPWAYQCGVMTQRGLCFLGAPVSYPFARWAGGEVPSLSKDSKDSPAPKIKRIDLAPHSRDRCTAPRVPMDDLPLGSLALDLLTLDLHRPVLADDDELGPHPDPRAGMELRCPLLDQVLDCLCDCPTKIVIRHTPGLIGFYPYASKANLHPAEYVGVLRNPASAGPEDLKGKEGYPNVWPEIPTLELRVAGARRIVLVFWTGPSEAWVPPFEAYVDGGDPEDMAEDETVWGSLATHISECETDEAEEIVVVNAGAVVPRGASAAEYEAQMRDAQVIAEFQSKRADDFRMEMEASFDLDTDVESKEDRAAVDKAELGDEVTKQDEFQDKEEELGDEPKEDDAEELSQEIKELSADSNFDPTEECGYRGARINGRFRFASMEEWIREDKWEDVFTRTEMGPWLERMGEQSPTGVSSPWVRYRAPE